MAGANQATIAVPVFEFEREQELNDTNEVKVRVPREIHRKLISLKVMRGKMLSATVCEALQYAFADQDAILGMEVLARVKPPTKIPAAIQERPIEMAFKELKVRMPAGYHLKLHELKSDRGITIQEFVARALEAYFLRFRQGHGQEVQVPVLT